MGNYKKIAGVLLVGVGGADLLLGNTSTPLPIVGDLFDGLHENRSFGAALELYRTARGGE
jgi:hypothetical protein